MLAAHGYTVHASTGKAEAADHHTLADDHLTLDAICGHSAKTKGNDYTKVTLKKRIEAMALFPQYKVSDLERAAA
jgi:hypothetical protein